MLRPWQICAGLVPLFCVTSCLYFFSTPDSLKPTGAPGARAKAGRWGAVDSDFDWCEANYVHSELVAEPLNSATSAFYPVMAISMHLAHRPASPSLWLKVLLAVTAVMGCGSVAFHGSLRYSTQLLDELPLYCMAVLAFAVLARRNCRGSAVQAATFAWAILLSAAILLTVGDREHPVHVVSRGLMTVTFAIAFIGVLATLSVAAGEVDARPAGRAPARSAAAADDGARLFNRAFAWFVGAILCWVLDIVACGPLRALPLGLPYPQLHALGWHGGTCVGLAYTFLLLLLHELRRDGKRAAVAWPRRAWQLPSVELSAAKKRA